MHQRYVLAGEALQAAAESYGDLTGIGVLESINNLKKYYQHLTRVVYIIYYLYLCTRKSEYCAVRGAINAF